jgi:hypothetical protein
MAHNPHGASPGRAGGGGDGGGAACAPATAAAVLARLPPDATPAERCDLLAARVAALEAEVTALKATHLATLREAEKVSEGRGLVRALLLHRTSAGLAAWPRRRRRRR